MRRNSLHYSTCSTKGALWLCVSVCAPLQSDIKHLSYSWEQRSQPPAHNIYTLTSKNYNWFRLSQRACAWNSNCPLALGGAISPHASSKLIKTNALAPVKLSSTKTEKWFTPWDSKFKIRLVICIEIITTLASNRVRRATPKKRALWCHS